MIILPRECSWPTVWKLNYGSGFKEPVDEDLGEIVRKGIWEFLNLRKIEPTHLVIGHELRSRLLDSRYVRGVMDIHIKPYEDQFMGLKLRWVDGAGLELLYGPPMATRRDLSENWRLKVEAL